MPMRMSFWTIPAQGFSRALGGYGEVGNMLALANMSPRRTILAALYH